MNRFPLCFVLSFFLLSSGCCTSAVWQAGRYSKSSPRPDGPLLVAKDGSVALKVKACRDEWKSIANVFARKRSFCVDRYVVGEARAMRQTLWKWQNDEKGREKLESYRSFTEKAALCRGPGCLLMGLELERPEDGGWRLVPSSYLGDDASVEDLPPQFSFADAEVQAMPPYRYKIGEDEYLFDVSSIRLRGGTDRGRVKWYIPFQVVLTPASVAVDVATSPVQAVVIFYGLAHSSN